ncbi:MAG: S1 RNA-binding domain-containing protein, partial [Candidatus Babeliales bacterium]
DNPWEKATASLTAGSTIKGKISSIADYGFFVEIQKGVEGLVHISEVSWTDRIDDLRKYFKVGDEVEALVVSVDKENRRMSLSIKQLQDNPWKKLHERFKVGDHVKGTISNIADFGIFVQILPGIDGLVHISDLSWTDHIHHPSDMYKKGDEVEAVILSIDEDNKRVSLGIKQLTEDPWEKIEEQYPVGSIVEGEVSKITNFGAFVKLPTRIEGLVHISELSNQNVGKVEDVLKVGQKAQFKIIKASKEDHKLGLSLRLDDDRTAKPEAKMASKQQAKPSAGSHKPKRAEEAVKTKSLLQIELEKHAARQKEKDETKMGEE